MSDHTTKDFFGDGYTTYHEDGTKSHTTKDFFGDGYTTYHEDGTKSHTTKDFFGNGTTTYHSDGSKSHTTKDFFGDGYTTYHEDGSRSHTTRDFFGDGYTTYHSGGGYSGSYGGGNYGGGYSGGSSGGYSSGYGGYGGYVGYGEYSSLSPGILGPLGIFWTILFSCAAGFMLWWDMSVFSPVLFALWAVVLASGVVERNRHNDYKEQDAWHVWTLLLATLMGIYLLYNRAGASGDTLHVAAHFLLPVAYMILMGFLCTRATGAQVNDWIVYLFVILMLIAWFMTIYTHYAGYGEFISVVLDVIFGVILVIALITALGCIKKHRLAILPFFAVIFAVNFVGYRITGFIGFQIIKDFIMGLF